jgi:MFS family permease
MIMLANLDMTIVNLAIPSMGQYFHAPIAHMQWILSIYYLGAVASFLVGGFYADRYGRKPVFLLGTLIFGISSLVIGTSNSLSLVLTMRFFQGVGFAVTLALAIAMIRDVFPESRHGFAIGIAITTTGISQALGPTVGGLLLALISWRFLFLLNVPLCVISLLLTYFLYHQKTSQGVQDAQRILSRSDLIFFKIKKFNVAIVIRAAYMAIWSGVLFLIPVYMQTTLHFSALKSGFILLFMTLFIGLGSPVTGKLIDKFGADCLISIALVLLVLSLGCLFIGMQYHHLPFLFLGLVFFGNSVALMLPSSIFIAMKSLPQQASGKGMGVYFTIAFLGSSLGVLAAAHVYTVGLLYGIYAIIGLFLLVISMMKIPFTHCVMA